MSKGFSVFVGVLLINMEHVSRVAFAKLWIGLMVSLCLCSAKEGAYFVYLNKTHKCVC